MIQKVCFDRGVGHDKGQHGCHVRLNHPRPFGNAAQGDLFTADGPFPDGDFGEPVRRHNAGLGIGNTVLVESRYQPLDPRLYFMDRQTVPDHPRRRHQNQVVCNAKRGGGKTGHGARIRKAFRSGCGIRNAAVGDHSLRRSGSNSLLIEKDRGCLEAVRRKHPRRRRRTGREDQRKVLAAIRLDSRVNTVCRKSGHPIIFCNPHRPLRSLLPNRFHPARLPTHRSIFCIFCRCRRDRVHFCRL